MFPYHYQSLWYVVISVRTKSFILYNIMNSVLLFAQSTCISHHKFRVIQHYKRSFLSIDQFIQYTPITMWQIDCHRLQNCNKTMINACPVTSNLQTNYHLKLDFLKVDQHAEDRWLIHVIKTRSCKAPIQYSKRRSRGRNSLVSGELQN